MYLARYLLSINIDRMGCTVYTSVPKAACSTIERMLANAYARQAGLKEIGNPHGARKKELLLHLGDPSCPSLGELLRQRKTFTVVRNPFSRVLSAYLDKIVGRTKEHEYFCRVSGRDASKAISFSEFLDAIEQIPVKQNDPHWAHQTHIVAPQVASYDYIGCVETLSSCIVWLQTEAKISVNIKDSYAAHRQSSEEKLSQYYTTQLIDTVSRIYRDDFVTFGYSTDPTKMAPLESDGSRTRRIAAFRDVRFVGLLEAHDLAAKGHRSKALRALRQWVDGDGALLADASEWHCLTNWAIAEGDGEMALFAASRGADTDCPNAILSAARAFLRFDGRIEFARELANRARALAPNLNGVEALLQRLDHRAGKR